jgi:NodT family efflux transporter outer membrane factor (OMF) lipoprotein
MTSSLTRRSPAFAALLATLLAGCSIPHDQPVVKPLSAASTGIAANAQALPISAAWWNALNDPQLDRIMDDALSGNPTLDAAMARVREAEAGIEANKAGLRPQIDAEASLQGERLSGKYIVPPPYAGTARWISSAQGNLSWNLDVAGRQKALIVQARSSAQAAALDGAAARTTIAGAVAQTYVNYARATAQEAIARDVIASRQQSLTLAQSRLRNHLTGDLDVEAAETLLAQAEQARIRATGQRQLMVHALAALAGRGADYYATITAPVVVLDGGMAVPAVIPADLLARRPDILAAQARIEASQAGRQVAKADFYPNVDLHAFVGASAIGLSSFFTGGAVTAGGGPAVHLPIFEGGRLKANYKGAVAEIDASIAAYNQLVVQSVREAADALSAIDTSRDDAAAQHRVVTGLTRTAQIDATRLRSGLGTRLDVLASGDRLLTARLALTDIDADGLNHRIQLAIALGGGFSPLHKDQTNERHTPQTLADAPAGNPKARRKGLLLLGGVILLGAVGYPAYSTLFTSPSEDTDDAYVAGDSVTITAREAGTVIALHADNTQGVAKGQPLIELDPATADVNLATARADLGRAVRNVRGPLRGSMKAVPRSPLRRPSCRGLATTSPGASPPPPMAPSRARMSPMPPTASVPRRPPWHWRRAATRRP